MATFSVIMKGQDNSSFSASMSEEKKSFSTDFGATYMGLTDRSVISANINDNGELELVYANGDTEILGVVVGRDGIDGIDGEDGVSVTSVRQTTTSNADGGTNVITVTLSNGKEYTFTVINGSKGSKGDTGAKGDKGDRGLQGVQGIQGIQGVKGDKGEPFTIAKVYNSISSMNSGYNTDGVKIGQFVVISTGNVDDEDNAKMFLKGNSKYEYITDLSGAQGMQGEKGERGEQGVQGANGKDGYTPQKGTDYWTPADKAEMVNDVISALPKYNGEVVSV